MDNIRIATCTNMKAHIAMVSNVLCITKDHKLYFKPEKCTFHAPSMDYLRVILEKGVTCMDPVKGAGIKTWPTPTNIMEVQKVLGFLNFYHPFIKGFAHIAYPLHKLTCKGYEWQWGKEKQDAFKQLKQLVTEEPVLAHADLEEQFEVEVDVLGYTVGAVLLQHKEDGKMHPLGYYLAMLNVAQ